MPESRHPLSFGVVIAQHQFTWPELVSHWKLAEELGFDSIWLFDHFMALYADPDGPCLETSTLLAALAKETSRVKIGVLVYGNTHRHPAVLAKEIVTVDHVSNGRAILGIGAGWNEREHRAYGIPFPSAGDRVEMLDEAMTIMESLFTEQRTTFHGAHYDLEDAPFAPKPVQPKLPVLIGGTRPKMFEVVARHADLWDPAATLPQLGKGSTRFARIARRSAATRLKSPSRPVLARTGWSKRPASKIDPHLSRRGVESVPFRLPAWWRGARIGETVGHQCDSPTARRARLTSGRKQTNFYGI